MKKGDKHTPEAIAKISAARKKQGPESRKKGIETRKRKGGPWHSLEARKKMSEAERPPSKFSPESRKKGVETRKRKGGPWHSLEARKKMSEAKQRSTYRHSPETRKKMSLAHKGRVRSPQELANVRAANKRRVFTPEALKRMSAGWRKKGWKPSPEALESYRQAGIQMRGENHPLWKGGKTRRNDGYIMCWVPAHPSKPVKEYVMQHRLIMEEMLGRFLLRREIVHHLNGIRDDNRPENLYLFPSHSAHMKHHGKWGAKRPVHPDTGEAIYA